MLESMDKRTLLLLTAFVDLGVASSILYGGISEYITVLVLWISIFCAVLIRVFKINAESMSRVKSKSEIIISIVGSSVIVAALIYTENYALSCFSAWLYLYILKEDIYKLKGIKS